MGADEPATTGRWPPGVQARTCQISLRLEDEANRAPAARPRPRQYRTIWTVQGRRDQCARQADPRVKDALRRAPTGDADAGRLTGPLRPARDGEHGCRAPEREARTRRRDRPPPGAARVRAPSHAASKGRRGAGATISSGSKRVRTDGEDVLAADLYVGSSGSLPASEDRCRATMTSTSRRQGTQTDDASLLCGRIE